MPEGSGHTTSWTVFRIAAILIALKALYHLFRNWEWIPDEEGWGTLAIISLFFWAVMALLIDVLMRHFMKDRGLLNVVQAFVLLAMYLFLDW